MATFVFIHGAGGRGSDWALLAAELLAQSSGDGHEIVAVDLPCEQESPLDAYVEAVVEAIGDRRGDLVLVAQSLGGLIAPLVTMRLPVDLLVFLTAMVPLPGETGGEWWTNTGHAEAFAAQDLPDDTDETVYLHDVPAQVLAAMEPPRDQTATLFEDPCPLLAWPDVPTRFLVCEDDRFFPPDWMRGVVRDRLGIDTDSVPGSHCAFLSEPQAVAAAVLRCWSDVHS